MAQLTLYKSIYKISNASIYELITPEAISASTFDVSGVNLIEILTPEIYTNPGIYSVNINAANYEVGIVYKIKWYIQYTLGSPVKTITNYFKFSLNANMSNGIMLQVSQTPIFISVV